MSRASRYCVVLFICLLLPIQMTGQRTTRGYVPPGMTEAHVSALKDTIDALAREEGHVPDWAQEHLTRFTVTIPSQNVAVAFGYWQAEQFGLVEGGLVFVLRNNEWGLVNQWSSPLVKIALAPEDLPAEQVGVLRVWVYPTAYVTIDDEGLSYANRTLANLSAGTHTVRLRADGYESFETDVTVIAGDTVTVMQPLVRQH